MKREDVRFKSVVTPRMQEVIENLLISKKFDIDRFRPKNDFIVVTRETLYRVTMSEFLDSESPYKEFKEICELIKTIEEPQPPFEFNTFDKILVRAGLDRCWIPKFFNKIHSEYIQDISGSQWNMMIEYEGNESFKNTIDMPESWWVVENDEPKLIRKESN